MFRNVCGKVLVIAVIVIAMLACLKANAAQVGAEPPQNYITAFGTNKYSVGFRHDDEKIFKFQFKTNLPNQQFIIRVVSGESEPILQESCKNQTPGEISLRVSQSYPLLDLLHLSLYHRLHN